MSAGGQRERKVITVLFCDLVGFTARAESLDPEDVEAVLRPYHERVRAELERHGGTVEKFAGDAVLALFGAPRAHEDDPERAVRAALAICDWAEDEDLQLRIGVTTGEALVSLTARPEMGEGMASGDVVNTASRLQAAAPEGVILVDETTRAATRRAIEYEEAQAISAKGKSEPVRVWKAVAARSRFGVDVVRGALTPLVGRRDDLEALVRALNRARRDREPQFITLVGVPGIGKSRLAYELFRIVEDDPEFVNWRQGRSLPYGEGMTYWALAEMVKAQAGILETDPAEVAEAKLRDSVSAAIDDPSDGRWVVEHLRPLAGLGSETEPGAGDDRLAESFAAWRRFFEALAEERPTVLVFEDLHWADEGLLDFVDYLADWASGVALLVVCTARPELLSRRPGWGGGKPNAQTILLSGLGQQETARLVHALLDRAVLPARLQAALLERAGGNPLYAEEFARMLTDRETLEDRELPLPDSLQGVIAARLDLLPGEEKELLQDAAVIGKVFWPGALSTLANGDHAPLEERLHALDRKQFLRRERRSSVAGETQYAFHHLLVRDVAYGQIPRARRFEKHRLVAEWIESLTSDRSEDRAEMLAYHYLAALEIAGAARIDTAPLLGRAGIALHHAGDRALALNAFAAAGRFYGAALDLVKEEDEARPYLLYRWVLASSQLEEPDLAAAAEAVAGFLASGDVEAAAEAEAFIALTVWERGQRNAAEEHMDQAFDLVRNAPRSATKVRVLEKRTRFLLWGDEHEAMVRAGREVLDMAEELGLDEIRGNILNNIGTSRVALGDVGGLADLERSKVIALELSSPLDLHRAQHNLMDSYRRLGRLAESAEALAQERSDDERFGLRQELRWVTGEEAVDRYLRGEWADALEHAQDLIAEVEAGSPHYMEVPCRIIVAVIRFARDDPRADEDSSRAVKLGWELKDPQALAPALARRAQELLATGRREEAVRLVDEALTYPLHFSALLDLAWVLAGLERHGELLSRAGEISPSPWRDAALAIAAGRADAAAEILSEIGAVSDAAYARLRSGYAIDVGRALDFYRSVGATRYIREAETLLAATA